MVLCSASPKDATVPGRKSCEALKRWGAELLADISDLQSVPKMHSPPKPIQSAVARTSVEEVVLARHKCRSRKQSGAPPQFPAKRLALLRALCFYCLDTASCPRRTSQREVRVAAPLFVGEKRTSKRRCGSFTLTRSLQNIRRRVKFKLSIATIRMLRGSTHLHASSRQRIGEQLLRITFQIVGQNNGLRDFFHGLAHLLALPLHGAIRFFLADSQLALQDALGALHKLSGFQPA